jgi:hypothetical protein
MSIFIIYEYRRGMEEKCTSLPLFPSNLNSGLQPNGLAA